MKKKSLHIFLWFLVTALWTILTLFLSKWVSVSKGISLNNALFFIPLCVIVVGILIIMARGSARNPVNFTERSHPLFKASDTDKIMTNNHGKRYGFDYNWNFLFNGYCVLVGGIICILIDVFISR